MNISRQLVSCLAATLVSQAAITWLWAAEVHHEHDLEEVVVTGSYIRGTPEDAASPVDVTTRAELDITGNPSIVELLRSLGPIAGIDGETNYFQSNGLEGISNVNLRGLGAGRTLVLMNGTRVVPSPFFIVQDGQQFVNTNIIPTVALERVELLKDGASALYGSDAVAGVVNFITRTDFRGLEFHGAWRDIDASQNEDYELGVILGFGTERLDFVISAGYQTRSEVQVNDKDWALQPFEVNSTPGGWSSIGNPGTLFPIAQLNANPDSSPIPFAFPDPDCETVGGSRQGPFCRFRYTEFFTIAEEEEHAQLFMEAVYDLGDFVHFHAELLWGGTELPIWKTSPSYPPQALLDGDQVVVPGMPHYDDFLRRNGLTDDPDWAEGALFWGRNFGVAGPAGVGTRDHDTYRASVGLHGELTHGFTFDLSLTYGYAIGRARIKDTRTENLAYAYRGLGGPNCARAAFYADPAGSGVVPGSGNLGTGDCFYYNPFTSGYAASQSYTARGVPGPGSENEALRNAPGLEPWLIEFMGSEPETEQLVFDLVFSGETEVAAGGGNVAWAGGFQWRRDDYANNLLDNSNLEVQPCAFGIQPGETFTVPETPINGGAQVIPAWEYTCIGAGPFNFLSASAPFEDDQDVFAFFGELHVPFSDRLEMQVAARYEDYGGGVGSTFDPKVAVRWQLADALALRASVSSAFRAPTLNQLGGEFTSLSFIASTLAFKAVDTRGNPDLDPEEALTLNFGVIWTPDDRTYVSVDYWDFDFAAPIILESFNDVVGNCFPAAGTTSDIQELACAKITFQDPNDPSAIGIQRIAVDYQNGPDIRTTGIDLNATYALDAGQGILTLGAQGTYIRRYEVDGWLWAPAFSAVGRLNYNTSTVRPLPELKVNLYLNWAGGNHNLRLDGWFTAEYEDDRSGTAIDAHRTLDLHWNYHLGNRTRLFASIYNLTDADPPLVLIDLNYDPYTHNPFGRMVKVGITHRLGR